MKNGLHEMMESITIDEVHMQKVIAQSADVIRLKPKRLTHKEFFLAQIYYFKSSSWLVQILTIFIGFFIAGYCVEYHLMSLLHFILSFSVIIIHSLSVPILLRSMDCQSIEVENVTYIPYRYALLAKMVWIGFSNLCFISILMLLTTGVYQLSLEQMLLYMLVPYNVTCLVSCFVLYVSRHAQGIYYCIFSNMILSIALFLLSNTKYYIDISYLFLWKILFLLSSILLVIAIYKLLLQIQRKEVTLYERSPLWN